MTEELKAKFRRSFKEFKTYTKDILTQIAPMISAIEGIKELTEQYIEKPLENNGIELLKQKYQELYDLSRSTEEKEVIS